MGLMLQHGWILDRINGSHHIFKKPGFRSVPVPVHGGNKELGILGRKILKQAGIDPDSTGGGH